MNARTATPTIAEEILDQEMAYFKAVEERDGGTVTRLTADECIVVGEQGVRRFDAKSVGEMASEHDSKTKYAIDESSVNVLPIDENTAVIAYKVRAEIRGNGAPTTMQSYDTSTWVRKEDGRWVCALHAEVPAKAAS